MNRAVSQREKKIDSIMALLLLHASGSPAPYSRLTVMKPKQRR
jgi:hypothetical protein